MTPARLKRSGIDGLTLTSAWGNLGVRSRYQLPAILPPPVATEC